MLIRNATEEDCRVLATVQVDSYRTAYAPLMPAEYLAAFSIDEQEQDWLDLLCADRELLLVAQNDEHLGGKANGEQFFEIAELNLHRREVGYIWEHIEDLF